MRILDLCLLVCVRWIRHQTYRTLISLYGNIRPIRQVSVFISLSRSSDKPVKVLYYIVLDFLTAKGQGLRHGRGGGAGVAQAPPSKSVDRFCMSPFWARGQRALGSPLFQWFWPNTFQLIVYFFSEANIEFLQLTLKKFEQIYNLLT